MLWPFARDARHPDIGKYRIVVSEVGRAAGSIYESCCILADRLWKLYIYKRTVVLVVQNRPPHGARCPRWHTRNWTNRMLELGRQYFRSKKRSCNHHLIGNKHENQSTQPWYGVNCVHYMHMYQFTDRLWHARLKCSEKQTSYIAMSVTRRKRDTWLLPACVHSCRKDQTKFAVILSEQYSYGGWFD